MRHTRLDETVDDSGYCSECGGDIDNGRYTCDPCDLGTCDHPVHCDACAIGMPFPTPTGLCGSCLNEQHWSSRKKKTKKDFANQAARTAWKIVQDWVEVQMSMIQLKQADVLQVFLPYLFDGRRTYYQALQESNFAGLLRDNNDERSDVVEGEFIAK